MKPGIVAAILILLVAGCTREVDPNPESELGLTCGVSNPIEELAWLRAEVDPNGDWEGSHHADFFVNRGVYKGETVIWIDICCPACGVMAPKIRNCEGTVLGTAGVDIQSDEITETTRIWRTNNGFCH